jgi:hypothetical protein
MMQLNFCFVKFGLMKVFKNHQPNRSVLLSKVLLLHLAGIVTETPLKVCAFGFVAAL